MCGCNNYGKNLGYNSYNGLQNYNSKQYGFSNNFQDLEPKTTIYAVITTDTTNVTISNLMIVGKIDVVTSFVVTIVIDMGVRFVLFQ